MPLEVADRGLLGLFADLNLDFTGIGIVVFRLLGVVAFGSGVTFVGLTLVVRVAAGSLFRGRSASASVRVERRFASSSPTRFDRKALTASKSSPAPSAGPRVGCSSAMIELRSVIQIFLVVSVVAGFVFVVDHC